MKKVFYFVCVIVLVVMCVVTNKNKEVNIAGLTGKGLNLKEMNDTTTANVVSFAEANTTTEGQKNLFQILSVGTWEHQYSNGFYTGADAIATVSSEFGVMCPTYDVRLGANFEGFRLEVKSGNFCRNNVKTAGFDPQFQNFCTVSGEGAAVSNAVQVSFLSANTKVSLGHQGGEKFYKFNSGNYYLSAEQRIKNLSISGGLNFDENTTGYTAMKLNSGNNIYTATANNLGCEKQNFVLSYNRNNVRVAKNVNMNLGTALWLQSEKKGLQVVGGLNLKGVNLFAEMGGYLLKKSLTPVFGLGASYKL